MSAPVGQTPNSGAIVLTSGGRCYAWLTRRSACQGQNLYLPTYFEESRTEVMHTLMRARPLAALVTLSDTGLIANHIPLETLPEPLPHGMLRGHIARANPLSRTQPSDSDARTLLQRPHA